MHPAFSVIFFTTATGAGYGMLIVLSVLAAIGALPAGPACALATMILALALITAGLLSSTLHLGGPERAWRAFSQWRSSWLSREGIASLVTYIPAIGFGIGWAVLGRAGGWVIDAAIAAALCALATLVTTGMIYASLKPIPQWHSRYTVPGYIIYAVMTGATLVHAALLVCGEETKAAGFIALAAAALGFVWKFATWRHNDALPHAVSMSSATGLADGEIRSIEWPHTEPNYVMKEMGYRIARKHAARLRLFVLAFDFAIPFALVALSLASGAPLAAMLAALAVLAQAPGALVERWLFFAEAKHAASLYYGR